MVVAGSTPAIAGATTVQQPGVDGSISARKTGVAQIDSARNDRPARTAEIPQITPTLSAARKRLPDTAPIGGRDRCDPASPKPALGSMICRPDLRASGQAEPSSPDKGRVSSLVETLADETGRSSQNIDDTAGAIAILGFPAGVDAPAKR